jgi:3-oxoacyl-[acyl-carrier-protein] synthase-1
MKTLGSIVAASAITPIGLKSIDTAFSHRAGAAGVREAPLLDPEGEPITMCFVPVIDPLLAGPPRAVALAARALAELAEKLGPGARALRARLAIALDEHAGRKGPDGAVSAEAIAGGLLVHARELLSDPRVEVSVRGAAGPGYLLPSLAESVASGAVDLAILGGVHTDYDPVRIDELATAGRLYRADRLDALIPGEAAAFVALMRPDAARRLGLAERAQLGPVATAHERARPDNDESAFTAMGLTSALRAALGPLADEGLRVGWALTDLTFETFRHFELQSAMTRAQRFFCEPQHVDSPAQRMGHLGAAAMPLHLALTAEAFPRGFAPSPRAISLAGSDGGERAVVVVAAPR